MAGDLEQEFAKALDQLLLADRPADLEDTDITVQRLCTQAGVTRYTGRKMIAGWVKGGKLVYLGKRREPVRGALVDAWRVVLSKQARKS